MLDIKFIRENVDLVKRVVKNKQLDISIVDSVLKIDEKKRKLIGEVEELRGLKNKYASEKNIEKGFWRRFRTVWFQGNRLWKAVRRHYF